MVTFEESRNRKPRSRSNSSRDSPRRDSGRRSGDRPNRSSFREGPKRKEFTKVVCSSCGADCEVPFRPTSNKPIYCEKCFAKDKTSKSSSKISERDLDIINEKLNKIMKALNID